MKRSVKTNAGPKAKTHAKPTAIAAKTKPAHQPTVDTAPNESEVISARTTYAMVVRMHQIHQIAFEQQQRDNGVRQWITCERLATELETTEKTIRETIKRMRDDHGLPIHYVEKRKGVGYTEPVTTMPTIVYSQLDSMALCFAMAGFSVIEGTPYAEPGRKALRRMTSGMRKELAVPAAALEKSVSFHCTGADKQIPFAAFEVITPAVIHRQELELDYAKPESSPASSIATDPLASNPGDSASGLRRVQPLHIACIDFCWYLFAWDPAKKAIRRFALRRIRSVRMTGTECPPRRFNLREHTRDDFGAHGGGKAKPVRLRLWGHAATVISELEWHHSQKFSAIPADQQHPTRPGEIEMTMLVSINPKLIGWVKEWLGEIAVLEPAKLRDDVRAAVEKGIADMDAFAAEIGTAVQ